MSTVIVAKYAGKCRTCNSKFAVGDRINWATGGGARCIACAPPQPQPQPQPQQRPAAPQPTTVEPVEEPVNAPEPKADTEAKAESGMDIDAYDDDDESAVIERLKKISRLERVVADFLERRDGEKPNPAKVGLYMKIFLTIDDD